MSWLEDVEVHLGAADRRHEAGGWAVVEGLLEASLPDDYTTFCDLYGACIVHDFLYVNHPMSRDLNMQRVFSLNSGFLRELRASDDADRIPWPLMGDGPGGMLLWGHTDLGDKCFLRPGDSGEWQVCVWYREGEWHESGLSFGDWIGNECRGVRGECNIFRFRNVGPRYVAVD